jgi:aldehyde dehydrogenase (NAD+)
MSISPSPSIEASGAEIVRIFKAQHANRYAVAGSDLKARLAKIKLLQEAVMRYRPMLKEAMFLDFRKNEAEVDLTEIYPVVAEAKLARMHLSDWIEKQYVETPIAMLGTSSYVQHEAKGVVLIISPWNFPINLTFCPLISALAAGNCVILKPSEMTPHTSAVMRKLIEEIFDEKEVAVVDGTAVAATTLLQQPFNHIFFTGAPSIGKVVMRAAAEHLCSVTLELGGKSPVVIDESADISVAAKRVAIGKYLNCGQICISPDYVLVHASKKQAFLDLVRKETAKFYGDSDASKQASDAYPRMVNAHHFERVRGYLVDAVTRGAKVEMGGVVDAKDCYISPTVLTDVPADSLVMQEEIFGPLMPVVTFEKLEEAVSYINTRDKPLALYIFSKNKKNIKFLMANTSAGGTCINETLLHFNNGHLPFGGSNTSGIGKCHGFAGFQEFANARAVLKQHFSVSTIQFLLPPYTPLVKRMIGWVVRWF